MYYFVVSRSKVKVIRPHEVQAKCAVTDELIVTVFKPNGNNGKKEKKGNAQAPKFSHPVRPMRRYDFPISVRVIAVDLNNTAVSRPGGWRTVVRLECKALTK